MHIRDSARPGGVHSSDLYGWGLGPRAIGLPVTSCWLLPRNLTHRRVSGSQVIRSHAQFQQPSRHTRQSLLDLELNVKRLNTGPQHRAQNDVLSITKINENNRRCEL